jgi:hypothetical protein
MTETTQPGQPGGRVQQSLLEPHEEAALSPTGLIPDPLKMVRYVTGVDAVGGWHAIEREHAEHTATRAAAA